MEYEGKNSEIREILNLQASQKRESSSMQNRLESQLNSSLAENSKLNRENLEIKEANAILLQIKASHEQLTLTLKQTEMNLYESNDNNNKLSKKFDNERLDFKTQKMELENINVRLVNENKSEFDRSNQKYDMLV